MNNDDLEKKWSKLNFQGFKQEEYAKKYPSWKAGAKKLLEFLEQWINVGIIADTAAGKTIIAILAVFALGKRTLFLTPQRLLTGQHSDLVALMDTNKEYLHSRFINGEVSKQKRIWNDPADQIVFATPHVVMAEIKNGSFNMGDFGLVVFDEMHKATGNYPYVPLAKIAYTSGLLSVGLSASPGGTIEKISIVKENLFLKDLFQTEVETPKKNEDIVVAKMDENIIQVEHLFTDMLLDIAGNIADLGIEMNRNSITNMRIFEDIERQLRRKNKYQGGYLAAKYRKLYHAYFIAITESYETFLEYLERMEQKDGSKSGWQIVLDDNTQKIANIARTNLHPKVEKFSELLSSLKQTGKNALVFFSQKSTALALKKNFSNGDFKIEILFGGADKNIKHQTEVLQKMAAREVDFIFTTSVAEEGLSVPEIDTVIHYSMPQTETALLQRSGRTGRMKTGHVIFLMIDHPLDKVFYYVAKAKTKKMRTIIREEMFSKQEPAKPTSPPKKGKRKKWKDDSTVPLFPDL